VASHQGAYEWAPEPSANPAFTGEGAEPYLETTGKRRITCANADTQGSYTGPKTESLTLVLVGCTTKIGGATVVCRSNPVKEGEIEMPELAGELGPITVSEKKAAAVDLKPKAPLTAFASFTCGESPGTISETLEGSVIARITPTNSMVSEFKAVYKLVAPGVQQYQSFEGGEKDTLALQLVEGLEPPKTEAAALHMKYVQTNAELAEISTHA
jgi:hypothetical protein